MNEPKWTTHRVTMPDDKALEYLDKLLVVVNEELLDPGYAIALSMAIDKMRAPLPDNKALTLFELREMNGETVYCLDLNSDVTVIAPRRGMIQLSYVSPESMSTWPANKVTTYRHPQEAKEE